MSTDIVAYNFQGHDVRIVHFEDRDEWVAKDVCDVLELSDTSMSVRSLDDDEKGTRIVCTPSGDQQMLTITEAGLYKLILRSRKPQAKLFSRWATHEVLPSIRKTGAYIAANEMASTRQDALATITQTFTTAIQSLVVSQASLLTQFNELRETVSARPLSDNCIGQRGAKLVSASLLEYAALMAAGDKRKARSIRGMAEVTLRASLNYNGTGRIWSLFPANCWPELKAKLDELYRAGKVCGAQQTLRV